MDKVKKHNNPECQTSMFISTSYLIYMRGTVKVASQHICHAMKVNGQVKV
jgi:hypothetical protein